MMDRSTVPGGTWRDHGMPTHTGEWHITHRWVLYHTQVSVISHTGEWHITHRWVIYHTQMGGIWQCCYINSCFVQVCAAQGGLSDSQSNSQIATLALNHRHALQANGIEKWNTATISAPHLTLTGNRSHFYGLSASNKERRTHHRQTSIGKDISVVSCANNPDFKTHLFLMH